MTMPAILFTALGAVLLVPYIFLRSKKRLLPGLFFKVSISVLFLLTAAAGILASGGQANLPLSAALFIGLVFGLLGDVFLDQKDMYPQHKDTYTFAGFLSFIAGHSFFLTGMLVTYAPGWRSLLPGAAAALAAGAGCLLIAKPLKMKYGRFKVISVFYGSFLTFLVGAMFACYAAGRARQALLMGIGGAAFLLSDLVLSQTFFCKGKDRPVDYALNYILYYGAQFTIALSLSMLG